MTNEERLFYEAERDFLSSCDLAKPYVIELLNDRNELKEKNNMKQNVISFLEEKKATQGELSAEDFATKISAEFAVGINEIYIEQMDRKLIDLFKKMYLVGNRLGIARDTINNLLGLTEAFSDTCDILLDNYNVIYKTQNDEPAKGGR